MSAGKNGNDGRTGRAPAPDQRILKPRGDPKTLLTFQKAEVIYDITFRFAHRYLARGDRTIDQMIQSARSGKKNILEGSRAAVISKEMEIKLTGVGRTSLAELLDDYEDFLRVREKAQWDRESKEALFVRRLGRKTPQTYELYREFVETRPPEVVANIAICLIHQTDYLLDRQLQRLEQDFLKEGGLRERMTEARLAQRKQSAKRQPPRIPMLPSLPISTSQINGTSGTSGNDERSPSPPENALFHLSKTQLT